MDVLAPLTVSAVPITGLLTVNAREPVPAVEKALTVYVPEDSADIGPRLMTASPQQPAAVFVPVLHSIAPSVPVGGATKFELKTVFEFASCTRIWTPERSLP